MTKKEAFKRLGYNELWLKYGIITEDFLIKQYNEILTSEDKNAEHYRLGGFCLFLETKKSLTDLDVENIFQLTDCGPDECDLRVERIRELIHSNLLNDVQLLEISKRPEVKKPPIRRMYFRSLLIHKIDKLGLTSEVFNEIKSTNDSAIQEYILDHRVISRELLVWLKENGLNKRIRNISKQLLNSRKYRN
ncbi:MAG: hypothetical protein GY757_46855 [bacterium]|nr:hypothetical protein [bacterium]